MDVQIFVLSAAIKVSLYCSHEKPKIPPAALEIIAFSSVARKEILPEDITDQVTPFLKYKCVLKMRRDQLVVFGSLGLCVTQYFIFEPSFSQFTT